MQLRMIDRLRLAQGFASVVRNPRNLDGVLELADRIAERDGAFEHVPPQLRKAIEAMDRQWQMPSLDGLRELPDGTLGREYARFMDENGLRPEALDRDVPDDPVQRFRAQVRSCHDLWHVATGWTPDLLGELGLQAFYLAQLRVPFPAFILAAGLAHVAWKAPRHFYEVVDAVAEGYRQGREAMPLVTVGWDEWMAMPVDEVRAALLITAATQRPEPVVPLVA